VMHLSCDAMFHFVAYLELSVPLKDFEHQSMFDLFTTKLSGFLFGRIITYINTVCNKTIMHMY